jgi:cyclohexanecarboxylate-CoA ligase
LGSTNGPGITGSAGSGDPHERGLVGAATLWELIELRARRSGGGLMLLDEAETRLSFGQFRDRAERVAAALYTAGVGPGSRVAWQLPSRVSTFLIMAALARLGAVQAPIIPAIVSGR